MINQEQPYIPHLVKWSIACMCIYAARRRRPIGAYYEPNFASRNIILSLGPNQLGCDKLHNRNLIKRRMSQLDTSPFGVSERCKAQPDERRSSASSEMGERCFEHVNAMEPFASMVHWISLTFNAYLLLKYSFLCLLDLEDYAHYGYLACLMPGRVLIDGRSTSLAKYIAMYISIFTFLWRFQMRFFGGKIFYFDLLEFIMKDFNELLHKDLADEEERTRNSTGLFESVPAELLQDRRYSTERHTKRADRNRLAVKQTVWSKRRRPTRTPEAWLYISNNLVILFVCAMSGCVLVAVTSLVFHTELYTTRLGFELTSEECVKWTVLKAKQLQRLAGLNDSTTTTPPSRLNQLETLIHDHIYWPESPDFRITDDMRAFFLPSEPRIDFNFYHLIRNIVQFLETGLLLFELASLLITGYILMLIYSRETLYYMAHIIKNLQKLQLMHYHRLMQESFAFMNTPQKLQNLWHDSNPGLGTGPLVLMGDQIDNDELDLLTQRLQTMTMDMFKNIRYSNVYVKLVSIRYLFIWFGLSMVVTFWMFRPGDFLLTSKLECYVIHLVATLYCAAYIWTVSQVRKKSRLLHNLIVSCMAMDTINSTGKLRWIRILRFYQPVPMASFTIAKSTEMSVSFGLKVVAWLFSGLFVASQIYTYYS